jgi:flagellar hook-length control protein FliK
MASVPNMRPGAAPLISGLTAPAVVAGAEFASLISAVPDALLQPVPTEACAEPAEEEAEATAVETPGVDVPSDATQRAALLPVAPVAVTPPPPPPPSVAGDTAVPPKVETRPTKTPVAKAPVPVAEVRPAHVPIADKAEQAQPIAPSPTTGEAPEPNVAAPIDPEADDDAQGNAPVAVEKAVEAAKQVIERVLRPVAPAATRASNATVRPQNGQVAREIEPVTDLSPPQPAAAPVALTPTPPAPAPLAAPANVPAPQAAETPDRAIERALDLAQDAEWLDRLARDIARTAEGDAPMRFRLHPQTLGHMRVELSQGDHGTSVRLTVETEAARAILADAQPRLAAEARAQGVRIAETHVDLSGSGDQRRQDETRQTPIIRTAREAAQGGAAPVQPARSRSDRYA